MQHQPLRREMIQAKEVEVKEERDHSAGEM